MIKNYIVLLLLLASSFFSLFAQSDNSRPAVTEENAIEVYIPVAHSWDESLALLKLPVRDSVTGCCVRERNIGDTIGAEELAYLESNGASAAVIPYDNNDNLIPELASYGNCWFDDLLPHYGRVKKAVGKGLTLRDVPYTYAVYYNKQGQIVDKWLKISGNSWKEVHQYDTLGRQCVVELFRNDTLMKRVRYTYHLASYRREVAQRELPTSELQASPVSYLCTLDKYGKVIREEKLMPDSVAPMYASDLCLFQYDAKNRIVNRLFYKHGKLVYYSFEVYDDPRSMSYSFSYDDFDNDQPGWISLLSKYGDTFFFGNLENVEEELKESDHYWLDFRYDRCGNLIREVQREDGRCSQTFCCRIRYW